MSEQQPPRAGSGEPTEASRPAEPSRSAERSRPGEPSGSVQPAGPANSAATGDARVDEALTRLAELADKPVREHAGVVEDIHRSLQDALAEDED